MKKTFLILLLMALTSCMAYAQWEQQAVITKVTANAKVVSFVCAVDSVTTYTSKSFEFNELGKATLYFNALCESIKGSPKVTAVLYGIQNDDGVKKDSLYTLFSARTAETILVDTISITGIAKYYTKYAVQLRGIALGRKDTRVWLRVYGIKD